MYYSIMAEVLSFVPDFWTVLKTLDGEGISYVELGGVKPNPRSGLVYEGIDLCRKEK